MSRKLARDITQLARAITHLAKDVNKVSQGYQHAPSDIEVRV